MQRQFERKESCLFGLISPGRHVGIGKGDDGPGDKRRDGGHHHTGWSASRPVGVWHEHGYQATLGVYGRWLLLSALSGLDSFRWPRETGVVKCVLA